MMDQDELHTFIESTGGLCSKPINSEGDFCLRVVPAKVVSRGDNVYLQKKCRDHGHEEVLIATDKEYYISRKNFLKPIERTKHFDMPVEHGCPYDCGLCRDHQQHSCVSVVEITDNCNLRCPTCYAGSGPGLKHKSLETVIRMLDSVIEHEGEADILQISGGEPTMHPEFFKILDEAKKRPVRYLMINTNGIRIAKEKGFAEKLASYKPNFGIYLQFDSFKPSALMTLRGEDLTESRYRAVENLNKVNISTGLVCTLQKGVNTDEVGKIINYAAREKAVRGVSFQPTQVAGRTENFNPATDRYTLTELRRDILSQTELFAPQDIVPVPCNPDALFTAFAIKREGKINPLSDYYPKPIDLLMMGARNTISFAKDDKLVQLGYKLFTAAPDPQRNAENIQKLFCCAPGLDVPTDLTFDNVFQVAGVRFVDAYDATIDALKRSCVHIATDDGKMIPFETMNMLYRTPKQRERLAYLQREKAGFW